MVLVGGPTPNTVEQYANILTALQRRSNVKTNQKVIAMKTKVELIAALYSQGTSRGLCPQWFQKMLKAIEEAK